MAHQRVDYIFGLPEAWQFYKKNEGKIIKKRVTYNTFFNLFYYFFEKQMEEIVERGWKWTMPYGLGSLFLTKNWNPTYVDIQESIKQKKRVLAFNDHTGGYAYGLEWTRPKNCPVCAVRKFKTRRFLKMYIKNKIKEYSSKGKFLPVHRVNEKK